MQFFYSFEEKRTRELVLNEDAKIADAIGVSFKEDISFSSQKSVMT